MPASLGNTLRDLRLRRGLSVQKLADIRGVNIISLWQYESGRGVPTLAVLQWLAAVLELELGDLQGLDLPSDNRRRSTKDDRRVGPR